MTGVLLEDVSLRDGLQLEQKFLALQDKIMLFRLLANAGFKRIQIGSFVHPKVLPQMADTDAFVRALRGEYPEIRITAMAFNHQGLERAAACGLKYLDTSVSASSTHSQKNVRRSRSEALSDAVALIHEAVAAAIQVRAGIQCAFGCVYEGAIPEDRVREMAVELMAAGADGLYLADTTGMANPLQVKRLAGSVRQAVPGKTLSLHLHDTRGLGLVNMLAGYEAGIDSFDVAAGGLGGCPFVTGAAGNVPAEDAVNLFAQIGIATGIDLDALCTAVDRYEKLLGRTLPGRMNRVLHARRACI